MKKHAIALAAILTAFSSTSVFAQDLVYEPVNPSFGGNPFNSAHLLAIANTQNDYERPEEDTTSQDDLDRFVRSLQSRLLSSLSTQVANAIFGDDAQDSGTVVFGDQTINFVRTLEGIELTIIGEDGSETRITIPTLILDTGDDDGDGDGDGDGNVDRPVPEGSSSGTLVADKDTGQITGQRILASSQNQTSSLNTLDTTPLSTQPIQQPIH